MNKFESIVLNVNDTFSKFFGYSSIQAKIIASILLLSSDKITFNLSIDFL